jgi:hypothetical protein
VRNARQKLKALSTFSKAKKEVCLAVTLLLLWDMPKKF